MTGAGECARFRRELGVYVLGAIAPADRAMVDNHLSSCPRCREEVAGLAGLPALLRRLPAATAAQLSQDTPGAHSPSPPGARLDALLVRVSNARRRHQWRLAGAATVLTAAAAAGWAPHMLQPLAQPHTPAPHWWTVAAEGFNPATRAGAKVRYTTRAWGTELEASVSGIPAGTTCQIWVMTASGQDVAAGGWTVARAKPHAWYPATVPVTAASLDGFDITAHGKVLVAIPLRVRNARGLPQHSQGPA